MPGIKTPLKASYYNHLFEAHKQFILFNAKTLAMATFPAHEFADIKYALNNPNEVDAKDEIRASLLEGGYLIEESHDEKAEISKRLWLARQDRTFCSLTIAPTLGCNFNCDYCFESEEVRSNFTPMSLEVQDKLIEFIKQHVNKNFTKKLEVTWFGGEPLLAVDVIQRLSENFIKICDELNISYSADMTTNGYRLNAKVAEILNKCRVYAAQVTIDGPEKIHDSRRVLKGGKGSYKRIISNIIEASEYIDVKIRINVDKQNYTYLNNLLKDIAPKIKDKNISVYLAPVTSDPNAKPEYQVSVGGKKFADIDLKFVHEGHEEGFDWSRMPALVTNACGADQSYSYMIGPRGEIYQCWDDFGNEELVVGSIFQEDKRNVEYIKQYLEFDPTSHKKCSNCNVMPLCMGGCPKQRLLHDEPQCGVYKYNLQERIISNLEKKGIFDILNQTKSNTALEKIENVKGYLELFHSPLLNNYTYMLVPRHNELNLYLNTVKNDTHALNQADTNLYNLCSKLLVDKQVPPLTKWYEAINSDNNLLGIYSAEECVRYIETSVINISFADYIKKEHPEILKSFISIPQKILKLVRLNFYLTEEHTLEYLAYLLRLFDSYPELFSLVDRLEIAIEEFYNPERAAYPSLIIYFLAEAVDTVDFNQLLNKSTAFPLSNRINTNPEFAYQWLPSATVTQGYKLYKRYLNMLGLLDDLYEKNFSYAFCREQAASLAKLFGIAKD